MKLNVTGRRRTALIVAIALIALVGGMGATGSLPFRNAAASPTLNPSAVAAASATPWVTAVGASPTATPQPSPTAEPTPAPPLPALLGAIGDSYTQAWGVSPQYPGDHTAFSWAIGTASSDGVSSLLERFRTLGASPVVVDAATSGKKMSDAPRQVELVVEAAQKLKAGQTAYVTFELGTNDLCASPEAMTDPVVFGMQLRSAIATLRVGLPKGSRILMLPVPDFPHLRDITLANPAAKASLALPPSNRCAPYLGTNSPSTLAQADDYLARYDASLKAACDDIETHEGPSGRLHCTYNASLLAASDFTIADLSTNDYYHPSLSGQAKMAESAWRADIWASSL